ncbi:unnamed protein product [Rangifer tarandus platyrhynchus]|uniref:Uncharacterized protein n=2 Tax=Rangifer tarandus platyrhynchus TaxID=3082113 RepID=A0ACB0ETW3_RANTA|nr:unnamed protein product [Rangifer tarandus platyrhynchus]CAI9703456.1 unnamed protein product [Rangifer tarandus platyrhynchus]
MAQPGPAPSCCCRGWRGRGGVEDRRRREVDGGQGLGRSDPDRQEVPRSGRALGSKAREGWRAASAAYLWCPGGAAAARLCSSPVSRRDVLEGGAGAGPARPLELVLPAPPGSGAGGRAPQHYSAPRNAGLLRGRPSAHAPRPRRRGWDPGCSGFSRSQQVPGASLRGQALGVDKDWRVPAITKTTGVSRPHVLGTAACGARAQWPCGRSAQSLEEEPREQRNAAGQRGALGLRPRIASHREKWS